MVTDGITFFPLKLDYSWPEPFDLIMTEVHCADKFRLKPMYNMTTQIPEAMRDYILQLIREFIQHERKIYCQQIDQLVIDVINQQKRCNEDIRSHELYPYYKRLVDKTRPNSLSSKLFVNCGMFSRT